MFRVVQIAARSGVKSDRNCCCKCSNEVAAKSIKREFQVREVAKSLMRVLDGREQVTLSRLLLKLRKGDVVKFVRQIWMYDDGAWERVVKDKSVSG